MRRPGCQYRLMTWRRVGVLAAAVAASGLIDVTAVMVARTQPDTALAQGLPALVLEGAAAVAATLAGMIILVRRLARLSGWLFLAAGPAIALAEFHQQADMQALTFTLALAASPAAAAVPLVAAAAAWPVSDSGRLDRLPVMVALIIVGGCGLGPVLFFDPATSGCHACPSNLLLLGADPRLSELLARVDTGAVLVCCTVLAALAVRRWARCPALIRRRSWPIIWGGIAVGMLGAVAGGHSLDLPLGQVDPVARTLWLGHCVAVLAMSVGPATLVLTARATARRLTEVVLAAAPDAPVLVASLASAVGDPHLAVSYLRSDGSQVDADGRPLQPDPERAVMRLTRRNSAFAEIRYNPGLMGAADLLHAAASSAGVALERIAAAAQLRAEFADAANARARVVAAGDAERVRLERNLHDGAQQRLVTLALMIRAARPAASSATGEVLDRAHDEIRRSLDELRILARGIFPTSLREGGLEAALRELGDHTAVPLTVTGAIGTTLPLPAAMAMYQLVVDVTRLAAGAAGSEAVTVELTQPDHATAAIRIVTDLLPADAAGQVLSHAQDRLLAISGHLSFRSARFSLIIDGVVPCGS